jgi:class 3 adenylate cyclase
MVETASNRKLSIMFSDIAGSTNLYDTLGDTSAEKCIAECLAMMSEKVIAHSGYVVKSIGDEIMAYFENADNAVEAARQIQLTSENIKIDDRRSVQLRIGMHMGPVIEKDNDIFGDAVNIAARMSGVAKAGQVMISEDLYLQLTQGSKYSCRLFDRTHVKGKQQALDVYQLVWEEQDQTQIISTHGSSVNESKGGLKIIYNGKSTFISSNDSVSAFTIGRDASCSLTINSNRASRFHLEIVWKRDKFILEDHSTNGTELTTDSGDSLLLKRESYPLIGKGKFTLGIDCEHVILFDVLDDN